MGANAAWNIVPLLTAIAGYIGGILSEPIKAAIKRRQEATILRRSLYSEMFRNMTVVEDALSNSKRKPDYFKTFNPYEDFLQFACYEHALKDEPILFNQLREARTLNEVYSVFYSLRNTKRNHEHLAAYSADIHVTMTNLIMSRQLDLFCCITLSSNEPFGAPMQRRIVGRLKRLRWWKKRQRPKQIDFCKRTELDSFIAKKEAEIDHAKKLYDDLTTKQRHRSSEDS